MDEPETEPLTDDDLARIRSKTLQMVGWSGFSGEWPALTWEEVKGWEAVSAEDGLRLVREVERLRDLSAVVVINLYDAATSETIDELAREGFDLPWAHEWLGGRETDDG